MNKEYYDKIISLYETNQKIKDLFEQEMEELESLLALENLDEESRKNFFVIQKSMEKLKINKRELDGLYSNLNQKPVVPFGILYPYKKENLYVYLLQKLKDLSTFYQEEIILFTIEDVDLKKMTVAGTIISGSNLKEGLSAIPPFIYNLTVHTKASSVKKMKRLRKLGVCKMINQINNFNQIIIFDILSSLPQSKSFIPNYDLFSPASLEEYLKENDSVLLLPETEVKISSLIHISKSKNENDIPILYMDFEGLRVECSPERIYEELNKRIKNKKFMIIKGIQPLLWLKTPLETRVYVQKNVHGKWEVTDLIGKSEFFSTENYQKNMCEQLPWILKNVMPQKASDILNNISDASIKSANYIDYFIPNLGSMAFDFLLDQDGALYFFHMKGWENKNLLREANKNSWDTYIQNSFHYLFYLFQNSRTSKDAKYVDQNFNK